MLGLRFELTSTISVTHLYSILHSKLGQTVNFCSNLNPDCNLISKLPILWEGKVFSRVCESLCLGDPHMDLFKLLQIGTPLRPWSCPPTSSTDRPSFYQEYLLTLRSFIMANSVQKYGSNISFLLLVRFYWWYLYNSRISARFTCRYIWVNCWLKI